MAAMSKSYYSYYYRVGFGKQSLTDFKNLENLQIGSDYVMGFYLG